MDFPLRPTKLIEMNSSEAAAGQSLYNRMPVVASLYVGVLGVAAVVGTFGNLVVIIMVCIKHIRGRGHRRTSDTGVGRAFIANLALSDLIVTSVINPLAIAGLSNI